MLCNGYFARGHYCLLLPCLVSLQPLDVNKVNYFVFNEERRTTSAQMTFDARFTYMLGA